MAEQFAALGYDPAPGDPATLREVAATWAALSTLLAEEAAGIGNIRAGLVWQGHAADACLQRLHVVPADLHVAADSCRRAAQAVQHYADALPALQARARAAEDAAAAARHALRVSDDPHVASTAHDQLTAALRAAAQVRDELEQRAGAVGNVLAAACEHAPHQPGWFHRMLHDLGDDLHDVARSLHDVVVDIAPTVQAIADWCSKASSVLAEVGFFVSLVPGPGDMVGSFLVGAGITLSAAAMAGHGLLAAEGVGSWRVVASDGAALGVALVSHGMEEPIAEEHLTGVEEAKALPSPWRSMPFMTTKEFTLRAVRLHVDGVGAALGSVDLAHLPEDWAAMVGQWRPHVAAAR